MAFTESALVLWTPVDPRRWRLFLVVFLVSMWRLNACERLTLPLARTRKRFLAPLLVFIFGMTTPVICCPRRCSPEERLDGLTPDRLRAWSRDASPPLSWGPAASPFTGPPISDTVRRHCTAPDRREFARVGESRTPGAPSLGRGNAASPWPCRLRPGSGSDS